MAFRSIILRRALSSQQQHQIPRPSISEVFIKQDIQNLLKDITRFEEKVLFAKRKVPVLKTPKMMFMTDQDLEDARSRAYAEIEAKLQMPPVMEPDTSQPKILSKDEEIIGYTRFKVMFVDSSPGQTNRSRLMSVREPDGTLRYPTHEERSRLNHLFYPADKRSIDPPKLFEDEYMIKLLQRGEYLYLLNRACIQFEPDDPRYVNIVSKVYNYIDFQNDFQKLRSTRHFGPMSLYLAYNKKIDNLLLEMLGKKLVEDAAKLVKIFNVCHNIECQEKDDMNILTSYAENHAQAKHNLDLMLQDIMGKTKSNPETNPE